MNLTRSQIHERLGSLSGEIKAAREQKRLTAEDLANRQHEVTLAAQADEKASANVARLEQEARDLAERYVSAVDELIAAPVVIEAGGDDGISVSAGEAFNQMVDGETGPRGSVWCAEHQVYHHEAFGCEGHRSIFTEPADFQAQALANGVERMNEALDRGREGF